MRSLIRQPQKYTKVHPQGFHMEKDKAHMISLILWDIKQMYEQNKKYKLIDTDNRMLVIRREDSGSQRR